MDRKFRNMRTIIALLLLGAAGLFGSEIIKFPVGSSSGDLQPGTLVKVAGENDISPCDSGETPVGIITGVEIHPAAPDSYVVGSSGVIPRVLVASGASVAAGDRVVPAEGGRIQPASENPYGFVIGVALESGGSDAAIKISVVMEGRPQGLIKAESTSFRLFRTP